MVRTRFAPSPTGYPHIGGIWQVWINRAFADKNHGKFIIRLEDTDLERLVPDAENKLYEALDWFGISEDESPRKGGPFVPYRQSERLPLYKKYAQKLVEEGHAYYCFCTPERLEKVRQEMQKQGKSPMYDKHCRAISLEDVKKRIDQGEAHVVRLKVPENETITVDDLLRGEVKFDSNSVDDQILLKSNGYPTYHLAAIVDDHEMEITHAVRGEEWLPSAPKHFLIYQFLGWKPPIYVHTPTLRNPDKSKLSKRQGHTNIDWYKEQGFLSEAVINFISQLGWSHPEEKEIFSSEDFIKLFDLKDLSSVGPVFDINKLEWMNGVYIRERLTLEELKKKIIDFYREDKEVLYFIKENNESIDKIIELAKTRMKRLKDFRDLVLWQSIKNINIDNKNELVKNLINELKQISKETWKKEEILNALREFSRNNKSSMKTVYLLLTGKEQGLPLPEMIEIYGRNKIISRLEEEL